MAPISSGHCWPWWQRVSRWEGQRRGLSLPVGLEPEAKASPSQEVKFTHLFISTSSAFAPEMACGECCQVLPDVSWFFLKQAVLTRCPTRNSHRVKAQEGARLKQPKAHLMLPGPRSPRTPGHLATLTKTKRRSKSLVSEMKHRISVQTDIMRMRGYSPNSIYTRSATLIKWDNASNSTNYHNSPNMERLLEPLKN